MSDDLDFWDRITQPQKDAQYQRIVVLLTQRKAKMAEEEKRRIKLTFTPDGVKSTFEVQENHLYEYTTGVNLLPPALQVPFPEAEKLSPHYTLTTEALKQLIYEIRDQWSTESGEWDASKMPVSELAHRLLITHNVRPKDKR